LIFEGNYDEFSLNDGEDRDFRNQFSDFLQKNTILDIPKPKAKKKKEAKKGRLEYFY
jgi:hypothetical protein